MKHNLFILFFFFLLPLGLVAQNEYVEVQSITIEGNKRTKENIILRELDFRVGDTLLTVDLMNRLERNRVQLMNADLFNKVEFNVINWENGRVDLKMDVVEDWYFFPLVVVDFADRNFNIWWVEQNRALNRVNFGLYLIHTNFTGRKDYIKTVTEAGYTQRLQLYYARPYMNEAQTLGGLFNIFYSRNHEVGYKSDGNILQFHREDEDFTLRRFYFDVGLTYRPEIRSRHQVTVNYRDYSITDSVKLLNPDFFLDGATRLQYLALDYNYTYDKRDFSRYPMKGYVAQLNVLKEGFGIFNEINSLYVTATYGQYWQFGKWSFGGIARARKGLITQKQPYYNSRALGYEEDFVRGYEYYVIDGQDFVFGKAFARFELFNRDINLGKTMPIKAFKILPLKYYLKVYSDHGYVNAPFHSEGNPLANEYLRGFGVGIDAVLYHDYVFRFEYSINHLKEKGFYFHYKVSF